MMASSVLLVVLGLAGLFLPEAVAGGLALPAGASQVVPLVAGGQLGFAAVNWVGRGAIYGGIYGKPIVLGNWLNGVIATSTLVDWQLDAPSASATGWVVVGLLVVYVAAFTRLLFWPPFRDSASPAG